MTRRYTEGRTVFRRWRFGDFSYQSDLIANGYMRRWVIATPWFGLRLHNILRSDSDEHYHDHPMSFVSVILRGGYVEYTPKEAPRTCTPGSVVVRNAADLHYLKLIGRSAWTFLITTRYFREWGFQTEDGWIPAGKYDDWKRNKLRASKPNFEHIYRAMGKGS